ncbi:MAG TPA: ABC transporter permease [Hansschlegelia sp.]
MAASEVKRSGGAPARDSAPRRPVRALLAPDRYRGFGVWFGFVVVFLYAPIVTLVVYSFNDGDMIGMWRGVSLRWYQATLADGSVRKALGNTLIVALCATLIAVSVATAAAVAIVRGAGRFERLSERLIALPLAIPEIVLAIATLMLFALIDLGSSLTTLVLAHAVFCTPFAFMPIRTALAQISVSMEEAARDLYCTPAECFRLVTLPLLAPGIVAGAMLSLVMSIDDFITSYILSGPGNTTVPVYIFSMIRQGVTPQINALSSLLFGLSLLLVAGFWFASRRS